MLGPHSAGDPIDADATVEARALPGLVPRGVVDDRQVSSLDIAPAGVNTSNRPEITLGGTHASVAEPGQQAMLYDLKGDLCEKPDMAKANPDVVVTLRARPSALNAHTSSRCGQACAGLKRNTTARS